MKVPNPDIKEIDKFVKVDFYIPGCPISGEEFLKYAKKLIKGEIPEIPQKPVCSECKKQGTEDCFLRKGKLCLGPVILAGCKAVCPKSDFHCLGCRGILKKANVKNFLKILEKFEGKEEVENSLEIFGVKDDYSNDAPEKIFVKIHNL